MVGYLACQDQLQQSVTENVQLVVSLSNHSLEDAMSKHGEEKVRWLVQEMARLIESQIWLHQIELHR